MTRLLKQLLAALCYRSGLLSFWWRSRRRPLIVMYHRVLEPDMGRDHSQAGIVVSTPSFARQLRFLARHFEIVPLATALPAAGTPPVAAHKKPLCAVTFDDGWADNHRCALPVLERHAVPSTVFMTSGYVGTPRLFWPERVSYALDTAARTRVRRELLDGVAPPIVAAVMQVVGSGDAALSDAIDGLIEILKTLEEDERESLIEVLAGATGRNAAVLEPRMLDWQAVEELAQAGVEIGSHGVSHAILTRVDAARAIEEVRASREQLAEAVGAPPRSFAYPNGDWSPAVVEAVRAAGYERAVATDPRGDGEAEASHYPYAVPRKNLAEGSSQGARGYSESIFACEVLGFFDAVRNRGGRR